MKKRNYLKGLRVLLAILFFVPILLFFVDFSGILPNNIHRLLHLQLMPAILGGMVGIVVFQFLLALVFGRIYCSTICPAGIFQDIINRLFCIGKKKKKGSRRFIYHKPMNRLRYVLLAITALTAIFGFSGLCLLLDPYSNFGRIMASLFRPVVMWGNNIFADLLMKIDNYSLFHVTISTVTVSGLIAAIVALLVFIVMTIFHGRLFCNTICPVGTLLSLFSRYSFFHITFDKETCTHCGNCEHTCKAEAIDSKNLTVDTSRCIDCFNCVSSCAKGGLQYRLQFSSKKQENTTANIKTTQALHSDRTATNSRRVFLATSTTVAASLPIISAIAKRGNRCGKGDGHWKNETPPSPLTPPGSISLQRFKDKCTGCQLCVVRCPSQVLRPTGLEYGLGYLLKPRLAYINSYCNYECTVCSDVCPTGAIKPLTVETKKTTQVGIATFFKGRCVVNTEEQDCGACAEHCPTQAVHMVPYKGTLTIPHVNPDLCIGCGGCESICPVRPMRAIIVKPNIQHKFVEKPKEEEIKEVEVDDFGF